MRCRSSRSLVFKSTIFPEWWTKRIMPVRLDSVLVRQKASTDSRTLVTRSANRSGTSESRLSLVSHVLAYGPPLYSYIPIQPDYSDLVDVAAFFIGAPDGTGSHDAIAKRIAAQGKKWSDEHWREVDMAAYLFRLREF